MAVNSSRPAAQLDSTVDSTALFNRGAIEGCLGHWQSARRCFAAAALASPGFTQARCSAALASLQLGELEQAEAEMRSLLRRYPLLAEARAALAALLSSRGNLAEAKAQWSAATRLDPRCRQQDWLLQSRHWPPLPLQALVPLLALALVDEASAAGIRTRLQDAGNGEQPGPSPLP